MRLWEQEHISSFNPYKKILCRLQKYFEKHLMSSGVKFSECDWPIGKSLIPSCSTPSAGSRTSIYKINIFSNSSIFIFNFVLFEWNAWWWLTDTGSGVVWKFHFWEGGFFVEVIWSIRWTKLVEKQNLVSWVNTNDVDDNFTLVT